MPEHKRIEHGAQAFSQCLRGDADKAKCAWWQVDITENMMWGANRTSGWIGIIVAILLFAY